MDIKDKIEDFFMTALGVLIIITPFVATVLLFVLIVTLIKFFWCF